ncbi:hypothetical protein FisN_30Hh060 [Fistulifera solaris]|jgi:hypothetical protein|uniref:Metallo-beta-lactamase domain-containing protein n=1 Tax=Fistulifera solaris TaxID=1519565 RepID=A0A1Z5K6K8_FISSO|nr:hypothetical protein FisN_30Hh060 [Fistulifera solaris]|eukprot:GAX21859.1 hypothetical protein FisN_30Hh060 [Fistulifera solaris]
MTKHRRDHPAAFPHGEIKEVFKDIFVVKGSVCFCAIFMPLINMTMSRNMTIIRYGDNELCLVNSIRLTDKGLEELDKLGKVKHIIRLAGYHGIDDPFYKERYGATVWTPANAPYFEDFNETNKPYFDADECFTKDSKLPFDNAHTLVIESGTIREAFIILDRAEGKVMVTGDAFQHISKGDEYTGFFSNIILEWMGFIKPYNIGPFWYAYSKPDKKEIVDLLNWKFDHVLPCHGEPVVCDAWKKYQPAITALK